MLKLSIINLTMKIMQQLAWCAMLMTYQSNAQCWNDCYFRSVGVTPVCALATDTFVSGMCYAQCASGYTLVGSNCVQTCPFQFTDNGDGTCQQSSSQYGRSSGFTTSSACASSGVTSLDTTLGCEYYVMLYYPVCATGYSNLACCICLSSGTCPSPLIGSSPPCTKAQYAQIPTSPVCPSNLVFGASGTQCFVECINGYDGDNLCCGACPTATPNTCNTVLCTSSMACSAAQTTATTAVLAAISAIISLSEQIYMPDIVSSVGQPALAISGSVCGQSSIASLASQRTQPHSCLQRRYPIFLGSNAGSTEIQSFDIDPNSNIGFGGVSSDLSLVSVSGANIAGILGATGFDYLWVTEFSVVGQIVRKITFNPSGEYLVILVEQTNLGIIVSNSIDGSIHSSVQDSSSQIQMISLDIAIFPTNNYVFLTGADTSSGSLFLLIGMDLINTPASLASQTVKINLLGGPNAIMFGPTSIFVGSISVINQNPSAGTLPSACFAIQEIGATFAGGIWTGTYIETIYNGVSYYPFKLQYRTIGSATVLYTAAQAYSGTPEILLLKLSKQASLSQVQYRYTENVNDILYVMDFMTITDFLMYALYVNRTRGTIIMITINFPDGVIVPIGSMTISQKLMIKSGVSYGITSQFRIMMNGEFYFSGNVNSHSGYNTCLTISLGPVGFIHYSDSSYACQVLGFSQGTTYTVIGDSTLTFQAYTFSTLPQTLTMSAFLITSSQVSQTLLYTTQNQCCLQTVNIPTMVSQNYPLDYPAISFTQNHMTIPSGTCTDQFQFTYTVTMTPSLTVPQPITYNLNDLVFTVRTALPADAIIYLIQLAGTLPNHQITYGSFMIHILPLPTGAYITPSPISSISYQIGDPLVQLIWQPFVTSNPTFYVLYYLEVKDPIFGTYSQSYDASFIQYSQGYTSCSLVVQTKDLTKIGTYVMRIVGQFTLSPTPPFSVNSDFIITVLNPCQRQYQIGLVPDLIIFDMAIYFKEMQIDFNNLPPICGTIIYKLVMLNNKPVPDFITFQAQQKNLQIMQLDDMTPGLYSMYLNGHIPKQMGIYLTLINQVLINVLVTCNVLTLSSPQLQDQSYHYTVGSPPLNINIYEFQQSPQCGILVSYSSYIEGGSPLPSEYIQFADIGLGVRSLTISASQNPSQNSFSVIIQAKIQSNDVGQKLIVGTLKTLIQVTQHIGFISTQYPPIYLIMNPGTSKQISLIEAGSKDDQPYLLNQKKQVQGSDSLQLSTLPVSSFDYSQGTLSLQISDSATDSTQYVVQTGISDYHAKKFLITQTIIILVTTQVITPQSQNHLIQQLQNQSQSFLNIVNEQVSSNSTLKAVIQNIDQSGLTTINFNMPVNDLQNLTLIDATLFNISVVITPLNRKRNLNLSWTAVAMNANQLVLQIVFQDPYIISIQQVISPYLIILEF